MGRALQLAELRLSPIQASSFLLTAAGFKREGRRHAPLFMEEKIFHMPIQKLRVLRALT